MRLRRWVPLAVIAATSLAGAPAASADTAQSSNWAGYAVHRSGVHFKKVTGTWTQPGAACTRGQATYSAVWVGLGGFAVNSPALEQIGTESDCTPSGRTTSSAWYELVPAASHGVRLTVRPGDRMRAGVTVSGSEVSLTLTNLTRHRSFTKRLHPAVVDTTAAEWILEAPSVCSRARGCHTLPLADFGSTGFTAAAATSTSGPRGSIQNRAWATTRISLAATGRTFVSESSTPSATAVPSSLSARGSAFTVTYEPHQPGVSANPTDPVHPAFVAGDRLARPDLTR